MEQINIKKGVLSKFKTVGKARFCWLTATHVFVGCLLGIGWFNFTQNSYLSENFKNLPNFIKTQLSPGDMWSHQFLNLVVPLLFWVAIQLFLR